MLLPAGGGAWASLSDRNAKENEQAVSPRQVLDRVAALPIGTWNYRTQDKATRHIGPMAQDSYAAFQLYEDDRHITTIDAEGVALAAILGLNQKVEGLKEELNLRDAENAQLKQRLENLEQLLSSKAGGEQ